MSPKYGRFLQYSIFFFSNEANEPPHVHVSLAGTPNNSSKFWITKDEAIMAHNDARIASRDLNKIQKYLRENAEDILECWNSFFLL